MVIAHRADISTRNLSVRFLSLFLSFYSLTNSTTLTINLTLHYALRRSQRRPLLTLRQTRADGSLYKALEANRAMLGLLSHRLHLSLPRKLPLATNPLHLPENNIGLLDLLARCLVLGRPFTKNRHHAVWFLRVLPLEYHRKFVLNRCT